MLRQILKRYKLWANLQGDVKFERETENVGMALTPAEESRLLANCATNPLLHTVVTLALNTALRRDEIRTLRWGHIDLFKRTLKVGRSKTEGGTGRVIPLNSAAYNALVRWAGLFSEAEPEHYVFPACESARVDSAKPCADRIDPTQAIRSWRTAWRRVTRAIECPALRFHDLRHTCIGTKDTACVDVCPVDCIHPAKGRTYDDGRPTYDEVPPLTPPSALIAVPVCRSVQ